MIDFFKPEDFIKFTSADELADIANSKLNSVLGTVVYQNKYQSDTDWSTHKSFGGASGVEDLTKYTAFLFNIKPKLPCEHQPVSIVESCESLDTTGMTQWLNRLKSKTTCKKCGVELVAEWKVK